MSICRSISVQIISKKFGIYQTETIGTSKDPDEIERFVQEAKNLIWYLKNQMPLFSTLSETNLAIESFLENTSNLQVRNIGPELIFGTLFDRIGFNAIPDKLFRHLGFFRK